MEPPEGGELTLRLSIAPASRQASSAAKEFVTEIVRQQTDQFGFLLDGYVSLDVCWKLHEKYRWESDKSADLDNIVKPLLDALSGPRGILIDDSQVKSYTSSWISTCSEDQEVEITVQYIADEWLPKVGLFFVQVEGPLCYPVPGDLHGAGLRFWLHWISAAIECRRNMENLTGSYFPARYLMPHGFFHRTRIHDFPVIKHAELLRSSGVA